MDTSVSEFLLNKALVRVEELETHVRHLEDRIDELEDLCGGCLYDME